MPKFNMRFLMFVAVGGLGAVAGKWLAERFVLKEDENDPNGFLLMQPGFGLDEVVGNTIQFGTGYVVARTLLGKKS